MTVAMDLEVAIEEASLSKRRNTPPDNVLCTLSVPLPTFASVALENKWWKFKKLHHSPQ